MHTLPPPADFFAHKALWDTKKIGFKCISNDYNILIEIKIKISITMNSIVAFIKIQIIIKY